MKVFVARMVRWIKKDNAPDEIKRARQLIAAIDAGGIPLNPMVVRKVAEDLGLEVSRKASMEDTIARIRAALMRY